MRIDNEITSAGLTWRAVTAAQLDETNCAPALGSLGKLDSAGIESQKIRSANHLDRES